MLELVEANPYTARAYRRTAETIRGAALPVAELVRSGRARELRGIGPGIEARWRDSCELLAVVGSAPDPHSLLARFGALPQIVAEIERGERRAVGVTVEGVPVELVVAEPERFGTALVRATGSRAYVAALEPLPAAPDEEAVYRALGVSWLPPELREGPFCGEPPALVALEDIRGDL